MLGVLSTCFWIISAESDLHLFCSISHSFYLSLFIYVKKNMTQRLFFFFRNKQVKEQSTNYSNPWNWISVLSTMYNISRNVSNDALRLNYSQAWALHWKYIATYQIYRSKTQSPIFYPIHREKSVLMPVMPLTAS